MIIKPIGYSASEMFTAASTGRLKAGADARIAPKLGESTSLSTDTTTVQSLVAKAMQPSSVHLDKLDSIKASIRDGSYRLDAAQTATAMLADRA